MSALLSLDPSQPKAQPQDTLMLWLPVFLMIGMGGYFALTREPATLLLIAALGLSVIMTVVTWRWRETYVWRWAVACAVLVPFGACLAQFRTFHLDTQLLTDRVWSSELQGTILEAERAGNGWRVVLDDNTNRHVLRLTIRQKSETLYQVGGQLHVRAGLMQPRAPLIPGMFDFQRHAYFNGISGYGYVTRVLNYTPPLTQSASLIQRYREWLAMRVHATLDQPEAGIVTALLNGQRGGISKATTNLLQASGLQHIISISGLHVGLMAGVVFYFVRLLLACSMRVALSWPIKKIAAVAAIFAIIAYMWIVGLSPATVRSVIMTSIVLFAILVEREAINLRLVAVAVLVILVLQPESVLDIGFQLSFSAVVGLVVFFQWTQSWWQHAAWNSNIAMKIIRVFAMTLVTTMVATLTTAPLTLVHFQKIPLLSMLSNVLATPLVTFLIMPGTVLSYLFSGHEWLLQWPIHMMGWGSMGLIRISDYVTSLPMAVWTVQAPHFVVILFLLLGLYILCSTSGKWRYAAIVPILIMCVLQFMHHVPHIVLTTDRVLGVVDRPNQTLYIEGRADSFQKNLLLQYLRLKQAKPMMCDTDLCDKDLYRIVRTVPALEQACDKAPSLIVTRYYLDQTCGDRLVIDRHDLDRQGGIAIYLSDQHVRYETVRYAGANRPWQQNPAKKDWYFKRRSPKLVTREVSHGQ